MSSSFCIMDNHITETTYTRLPLLVRQSNRVTAPGFVGITLQRSMFLSTDARRKGVNQFCFDRWSETRPSAAMIFVQSCEQNLPFTVRCAPECFTEAVSSWPANRESPQGRRAATRAKSPRFRTGEYRACSATISGIWVWGALAKRKDGCGQIFSAVRGARGAYHLDKPIFDGSFVVMRKSSQEDYANSLRSSVLDCFPCGIQDCFPQRNPLEDYTAVSVFKRFCEGKHD
ncbi:hypothetical protein RRG08_011133 [Elysia crispata]|uniref:Uncharacterized protein n=1 Tax=Elysia crispata TaxID=231223 RepID=A0AAE1A0K9_9GAST|nr:hypothetical protein RRG08_011133 [Elysia crispata]